MLADVASGGGHVSTSDREAIARTTWPPPPAGPAQGWVGVGVGTGRTAPGRYRFGQWCEVRGDGRHNTAELLAGLLKASLIADVYACPYLMARPEPREG